MTGKKDTIPDDVVKAENLLTRAQAIEELHFYGPQLVTEANTPLPVN
jgi:hypothetical protein